MCVQAIIPIALSWVAQHKHDRSEPLVSGSAEWSGSCDEKVKSFDWSVFFSSTMYFKYCYRYRSLRPLAPASVTITRNAQLD